MPDVVTFDPANLRIIEITTGGDNELDIVEVYSEWKDWLLADPARLAYPQAFRFAGGDPISESDSLGSTYFLLNGWRIRPAEHSHRLAIAGNLYTDPAGEDPVVATLSAFNVRVLMRVSNIIDQRTVDTGGTFTEADRTKLITVYDERFTPADRATLVHVHTMMHSMDTMVAMLHKHAKNRLRIDVATQKLILYDDDNTTILHQWTLIAKGGGALLIPDGIQIDRQVDF